MPDILIRGVDAPTSCETCKDFFLREYDFPCYRARCSIGGTVPPYPLRFEKRGDDCPILELPEHGDLISKQTALAALYSDSAYAAMEIIEKEVPVIVPADNNKAAPAATGPARK